MSKYIAYPCGCSTDDDFKGTRQRCKHGKSYQPSENFSEGAKDNMNKNREEDDED